MKSRPEIPSEWSWHYRTLSRLREILLHERNEHAAAFRQPLDHGGEDKIDVAEDQREHLQLLAELRAEQAEIAEIDAALTRIRQGSYGICEATGERIAGARLRALPWTRLCARAAAGSENRAR